VGELAARRIIEEREKNGAFAGFDDFVSRVDGRAINKRVLEHLVKTGAFDFGGVARRTLFEGLDGALATVAASVRDREAGQHSFLSVLASPPAVSGGRRPAGPSGGADFEEGERLGFEKELLGFYISGHPLDRYGDLIAALDTFPAETLSSQPGRTEFRLCGVAGGISKKLSKKDNRPWAAFQLATRHASIPLNLFADAYSAYSAAVAENAPLLVLGAVMAGTDGVRISVKECYPLESAAAGLVRRVTWILDPIHPAAGEFLRAMRETVTAQPGDTRLEFAFVLGDRLAPVAEASPALSWRLNAAGLQSLRSHPAVVGVRFETKRLELKSQRFRR
jgi:DNA polymerase-3 subunit alpha